MTVQPAFAKINLCLFVGPTRSDGRHELVTLFESVDLADELHIVLGDGDGSDGARDEVVCEGVPGPNLVGEALGALRAAGWRAPPVRVTIAKRIPVAAGMGGGSADAAALLRAAPALAPVGAEAVQSIAARLGADVPGQLRPGASLGTGAGEAVDLLPDLAGHSLVVVPAPFALATPEVYREADRLGIGRPPAELAELRRRVAEAATAGAPFPPALIVNDLQPAALSLRPAIGDVLDEVKEAGADQAIVCGSGPTVLGLCWNADARARAAAAAARLAARHPRAQAAAPVRTGFAPAAAKE